MISIYQNVPKTFMPVLWFEQHVKMSSEIADEIKLVLTIPSMGQMMGVAVMLLGFVMVIMLPLINFLIGRCCTKEKDSEKSADEKIRLPEVFPLISDKEKIYKTTIVENTVKS